eukprot:IDg507t1
MDECLDSLGTAKVFSALDANSGYWQMSVAEDSVDKTAFVSHSGFFEWTRMPFGLTNAPATFQRALDLILARYKWRSCLVYLDTLSSFQIQSNPTSNISMNPSALLKKLSNRRYWHCHNRSFRTNCTPTPAPTKSVAPYFKIPDRSLRPVGFWSRTLNAAEKNYSPTERECLAVIYGVTTCRPYLYGQRFKVVTDHNSLRWLLEINDPASGRLMRWRIRLAE